MPRFSFSFSKSKQSLEIDKGVSNIRLYTLSELKLATQNFGPANKIGEGVFASVYVGRLKDGKMAAIKVLSAPSKSGVQEFLSEINIISDIEHENLVKLYGCCVEGQIRILVSEYLENNTLAQTLLNGSDDCSIHFDWNIRAKICIGVARGLAFLHEQVQPPIVHQQIQASNILLDKDLTPKISDFGIARLIDNTSHVSTHAIGTIGYMAPEYAIRGQLTRKADVYSFGVLLMEIVSGRCNNRMLTIEEQNLLERTWDLYERRELVALVDTKLNGDFDAEEVCRFLKIGLLCTQDNPKLRPSMSTVVNMLTGNIDVGENKITKSGIISDFMDHKVRAPNKTMPDKESMSYTVSKSSSTSDDSVSTKPGEITEIITHQRAESLRHGKSSSDLMSFEAEGMSSKPEIEILSIHESETQSLSSKSQVADRDGSNREIIFMRSAEPMDQAEIELHHRTHGGSSPEHRRILRRTIQDNVQNVLRCMNDIKTRRIGIYGNGGIGKTTVLKAFISQPEPKIMFDLIVWVTVSRYWTTRKIQNEIMKQLALSPVDSGTDSEIAERLFQALRSRKFLLLLDDVWDWIDLDLVGIPGTSQETGCKIIVSTRSVNVCHIMAADAEIRVKGLAWEEAWELFCEQVGGIVESPDINPFARGIVKECSGLPLAIIVTGRALRDENDVLVWKHALQEFSLPSSTAINGTETVIQQLKFCYHRLRSRETKSFFLYCALFPEDHEVNVSKLVEYCIQEGLVAGDLVNAQKKGYDIIEILVNVALLEISEDGLSIRMHDVIRDLALQVLSSDAKGCQFLEGADLRLTQTTNVENSSVNFEKPELSLSEGHHFLLSAGARLTEPPLEKEWQNAKMIFLMDNDISRLPEMPRCPNLLRLFLQRNYLLRVMPMSFFDYMPSLQVLNLSNTRIKSLPKSLFRLMSLQILILRNCERLLILPSEVGALKKLEILDLRGTEIEKLPDEVGELVCLKDLKVSFYGTTNCSENVKLSHELVQRGVMSRLLTLEKLGIVVQPGDQRWTRSVESIVVELGSLTRLTALSFYFPEVDLLRLFLEMSPVWKVKGLTEFNFVVGHNVKRIVARVPKDVEFDYGRRGQCLRFVNGDTIPGSILEVLICTTAFYLDHHLNINSLSDFELSNVTGLEFCVVRECPMMCTIVAGKDTTVVVLPVLGCLSIHYLWNLKSIWEGVLPYGSFVRLRILSVHTCPKLTFIFSYSMLPYVSNLEELVVEDCPSIKEIVNEDKAINSCFVVLPSLKRLVLHYLPALLNIWKGHWPSLEHISFYDCPSLTNIGMDSKLKHTLKEIKAEKTWWDALEWDETALFRHLQSRFIDISDDNL